MKNIIDKNYDKTYIINKSKFIVYLFKIENMDDINIKLSDLKDKYKDATHHCYAYIFDSYEKCSDDKEPSGTAGIPILNVLKKNNLNKILCVVVRYFGGVKLGAGGLVRAYSNVVSDTLKEINIIEDILYKNIVVEFSYDKLKDVEYILKDYQIIYKTFENDIKFEVKIDINNLDIILSKLNSLNIKINIM